MCRCTAIETALSLSANGLRKLLLKTMKTKLIYFFALLAGFCQAVYGDPSRIENGFLIVPRIDVGDSQSFELVFRIETGADTLFFLEVAAEPSATATSSGFFDAVSQTLALTEIQLSSTESYSATLALVSQSPSIVFRLSNAALITDSTTDPETALDIQATMALPQLNCTNSSCHDVTPGVSRINLHTGTLAELAARLVDQPSGSPSCAAEKLIDSINPENSLLLKLIDPDSGEQCIAKMPFGQSGVDSQYYSEFEDWVYQLIGAADELSQPTDNQNDEIIQALDGFSALRRAKYLLHGGAVENDEYELALDDNGDIDSDGYRSVINTWFDTPAFERKMLSFLAVAFQQNALGPIFPEYFEQLGATWGHDICTVRPEGLYTHDAMEVVLTEIIPRTAYRLIESGADFRTIKTTDEIVTNTIGLYAMALGDQQVSDNRAEAGHNLCQLPDLALSDFNDWRVVKLLPSSTPANFVGNDSSFAQSLRDIPDGGSFSLMANRTGLCNSFSFLANWPTNVSNQFRLNVSQCMIASLGLIFEAGDSTAPNSLDGLDEVHVDPTTECYGCHQHMDPMTNVFRGQYDLSHRILESIAEDNDGDFSFHGYSQTVSSMDEFNAALSSHPNFAMGIALKLCQWATSEACSSEDPDLQSVVADFSSSGHQFKELVLSLFTSPLITTLNQSGDYAESGSKVSASRAQHMCLSLEARMEQQLATDRVATSEPDPKVCQSSYDARQATESIPQDLFQRGYAEFIQASAINLLTPKLHEPLCDAVRHPVMQAYEGYNESRTTETLNSLTQYLLGVPTVSPTYAASRQSLESLYDVARAPQCASTSELSDSLNGDQSCGFGMEHTTAMELLIRNICLSPATTAIGL